MFWNLTNASLLTPLLKIDAGWCLKAIRYGISLMVPVPRHVAVGMHADHPAFRITGTFMCILIRSDIDCRYHVAVVVLSSWLEKIIPVTAFAWVPCRTLTPESNL
jgi:hypothetical protein